LPCSTQDLGNFAGIEGGGGEPDPAKPTAVLLVGKFGGLGVHSMLSIQRTFPGYFANLIFVSVAVHDSGTFKGTAEVDAQRRAVEDSARRYVALARSLGWNSSLSHRRGTGSGPRGHAPVHSAFSRLLARGVFRRQAHLEAGNLDAANLAQ
jgi:hypothetical protein